MFYLTNASAASARVVEFINRCGSGFDSMEEVSDFMEGAAETSNGFVCADVCEEWFDDEGEGHSCVINKGAIWYPPCDEWED